jgi:triacylglycerol lipase
MQWKHHIFLAPGFFGFANLGDLVYFGHVRAFLLEALRQRGVDAEVIPVLSHPTASIRTRAKDLHQAIAQVAGERGPLHLIGHSTGGLDARLFVSPGVDLGAQAGLTPVEALASRVRSVVTVATPHRGTGLASFFSGLFGARLLGLLSLATVYVLRFGRIPLTYGFRLAATLVKMDHRLGWRETLLDQLFAELLGDFSPERREALTAFFGQVGADQSLVAQLTPEGMDLFNASVQDRPGVRYGSVVTRARPPSAWSHLSTGLDPYAQLTQGLYALIHHRAPIRSPSLSSAHQAGLRAAYGAFKLEAASDGIVPTLSQPYGELLAAVWADHLDVIGHFDGPEHRPPHIDWLLSGTGFRRSDFERVWTQVAEFVLQASDRA